MANWFGRVETIVVGILSCVFGAILFSRLDRGLPIWASFFVGPGLWIIGGSIAMSWLFNRMFQRAQRPPHLETPTGANQTHMAEMPDSSLAPLSTSEMEPEPVRAEPVGSTSADTIRPSTLEDEEHTPDYFWVVTCKNDRFHRKENISYHHRILLGETDSYLPLPMLPVEFKVRCDSCGEEYSYSRREVLRAEVRVRETFIPHTLFST